MLADTQLTSELLEVEFPVGTSERIRCIDIPIMDDRALEDNHDFFMTITGVESSSHATLNSLSTVTRVTIIDDESESQNTCILDFYTSKIQTAKVTEARKC